MDNQTQEQKCLECRECCDYVEYPVTALSLEVVEYFLMRGEQIYIDDKSGMLMVRNYHPCIHLKDDGCDIYENRPWTCQKFMCELKDKTIKQAKQMLCDQSMARIIEALENRRKEQ